MSSTTHKIRFHIGAHKTATTYLQNLLQTNQGRISENGEAYWELERCRENISNLVHHPAPSGRKGFLGVRRGPSVPQRDMAALTALFGIDRNVILSEENAIGHGSDAIQGAIYPSAVERLRRLTPSFGDKKIEFWLCIRNYAPFISSLYAETLRHGVFQPPEDIVSANKQLSEGWLALIHNLQSAFPAADITLWRYEDFKSLRDQIVTGLSGLQIEAVKPLESAIVRPSASAKAIDEMIRLAPGLSQSVRIQTMAALEEAHPHAKSNASFQLFHDNDISRFNGMYADEWAKLTSYPSLRCLV